MSYVESGTQKLRNLIPEVENGQIKIPQFQRDFVWTVHKAAELIDSVIRGFPIGSLIYWRTADRLREVRDLGRLQFPIASDGERVSYVLDGQQRLTSLLAALEGQKVTLRDGSQRDFSSILVHLNPTDEDAPFVRTDSPDDSAPVCLPLTELWSRKGKAFDSCEGEIRVKRDDLSDRLRTYDIPKVTLNEAELSEATEVFSRINTGGQELSVFEIMVAKTYDPEQEFDLVEKYDELAGELQDAGFGTIDAATMLQLVALMLRDDCKKRTILDLGRDEFIDSWSPATRSVKSAVDYIRESFRIPVSRLLPYVSLVVPIALFFHGTQWKPPTKRQAKLLSDFFWKAAWSQRYSSSSDTRLSQDKDVVEHILEEQRPRLDWVDPFVPERVLDTTFSASTAFSKTTLALLASLQPQKYDSGDLVNIQNDHLQRANSLNYHHVFPKAYLKGQGYEDWEANRLINISLVDDFLNKRKIRARSPSDYMEDFYDDQLEEIMKTHLIESHWVDDDDPDKSAAIWSDDYERFIRDRADAIVQELRSRTLQ